MGKRYSLEEVKKILKSTGEAAGLPCNHIPVEISTRMKRTYGVFLFKIENGRIRPLAFRFSEKLLSGDFPDELVENTIKHEYAHFYTTLVTGENHMHDSYFKAVCKKLGIPGDTRFQGCHQEEIKNGYKIHCSKCMNEVARRRRRDATRVLVGKYLSGCCSAKLLARKDRF